MACAGLRHEPMQRAAYSAVYVHLHTLKCPPDITLKVESGQVGVSLVGLVPWECGGSCRRRAS